MQKAAVQISLEFTPNPNTLKFVVNPPLFKQGAANFTNPDAAAHSPLAQKLFAVPGVSAVLLGSGFVTITKTPDGDWDVLADKVPETIDQHVSSGTPIFEEGYDPMARTATTATGEDAEVENKVREILDAEIRPAVAMDGGDITFGRYENGVVYLHLQGACSSCPSSIATLKMGVETRLKELIPQIKEVVQV